VLESFKERGDCTDYALYIMTTPNPAHTDPVRFFALQCLGKVSVFCGLIGVSLRICDSSVDAARPVTLHCNHYAGVLLSFHAPFVVSVVHSAFASTHRLLLIDCLLLLTDCEQRVG
jgi:hypothetical protein